MGGKFNCSMHPKRIKPTSKLMKYILIYLFPDKNIAVENLRLIAMIIFGALVIYPIVNLLPMLGWDWFYYFNCNNHSLNINLQNSIYPPYTSWILSAITWLDWRISLSILNSVTLITIALSTWKQGGRWLAIFYAICNPPVLMLLWIGHPDGLVLFGVVTGLIPLIFIKPQVAVWSFLSSLRQLIWATIFFILTILIWPDWLLNLATFIKSIINNNQILLVNEATIGWGVLGFPIFFVGLILIIGAGKNPFRLMASGCFLSPYLMPYHLAILTPIIGKGNTILKQTVIWLSTWLIFFAVGLNGYYKMLMYVFPLTAFILSLAPNDYIENIGYFSKLFKRKS